MTKVAYSNRYGGFGLSIAAMRRYAEITNSECICNHSEFGMDHYFIRDGAREFYDFDMSRTDPALIQVIEELGTERASGNHASLQIRELAPGTRYRIDDYDGNESVMTPEDYDWQIA